MIKLADRQSPAMLRLPDGKMEFDVRLNKIAGLVQVAGACRPPPARHRIDAIKPSNQSPIASNRLPFEDCSSYVWMFGTVEALDMQCVNVGAGITPAVIAANAAIITTRPTNRFVFIVVRPHRP